MIVKRLLLALLLLVILPLSIYGVYSQIQAAGVRQTLISQTLIDPYLKALQDGRYGEAYDTLTSAGYRRAYSHEDFEKAQLAARKARGRLEEIQVLTAFQSAGELFSERRYLRGQLRYRYEKEEIVVVWETSASEPFLIEAQFEDLTDTLSPGIF